MRKNLLLIIAILITIGVVIGCIYWYEIATNNMLNVTNTESTDIEDTPIFTLENYPKVDASLAIHPLVNSIASNFLGIPEEELNFEYTTSRSSDVYKNLIDGNVDIIFAAEISDVDKKYAEEKGVELNIIPATSSAFVFIVNTENPINGLTIEQIQKIYTGEITSWNELGRRRY